MTGTRASDADRDSCLEDIEAAFADGRLNDAEREIRTQKALQATTLDELARLVSDLGPSAISTVGGRSRRRKGTGAPSSRPLGLLVGIAVVVAVAVVATAFGWPGWGTGDDPTVFGGLPGQAAPAEPGEEPEVSVPKGRVALHTAKGFSTFVKLTRQKFGTTLVESAAIYPDYASVNVATKADDRRTERWYFAKGYEGDASSKGTRQADAPLIDVARIDTKALVRNIKRAPSVLGVSDIKNTYLVLDDREDQPSYSVYVSNEYSETGYFTFDLSGKEIFRYTFE